MRAASNIHGGFYRNGSNSYLGRSGNHIRVYLPSLDLVERRAAVVLFVVGWALLLLR